MERPAPTARQDSPETERASPRTNLFLMATIVIGEKVRPVRIRNLSPHGALVETIGLPAPGTAVTLRRGSLMVEATLMWADEQRGGICFDAAITLDDWLPFGPGLTRGQAHVDRILARTRDQLAARDTAPSADRLHNQDLPRRVEEIGEVARRLDDLGRALGPERGAHLQEIETLFEAIRRLEQKLSRDQGQDIQSMRMIDLQRQIERRNAIA